IKIEPFDKGLVGSCSVDFRLGNQFKRLKHKTKPLHIQGNVEYSDDFHEELILKDSDYLKLKPGELVLGTTLETLTLDDTLCGLIQGRSRLARLGLLVHVSSSLIQPGVSNKQVLEIVNLSPQTMYIKPKTVICQIVFQSLKGKARYSGRYARQTKA
ncbi:MAG: dCTP deaminase, partial [Candidatus Micrarchaeota archaeon]|nr:dCTP deaminase [Candidatus Micrarchaeota archaeon]